MPPPPPEPRRCAPEGAYDPPMAERWDSTGQVIIEFLAFMTAIMAAMAAFMDDLMELVEPFLR